MSPNPRENVVEVASHDLFCIRDWATKERGKSFGRWLKQPAKSDEGKFHLTRSEVMQEVVRKITREIRKQNANVDLPDTAAQGSASKSNNPAVSG